MIKTESDESDARFSPDGRRIAFVRNLDLYVFDIASGKETRLTDDGRENTTLNGINDWVYGEEIWGREPRGYWWSPDSAHIAYYHFDERSVGIYSLLNAAPLYPEIVLQKYPKAGTTNPQVKIGVADLATGRTTWIADRRSQRLPGAPGVDAEGGRRGDRTADPRPEAAGPPPLRRRRRRLRRAAERELADLDQSRPRLPVPPRWPLPLGLRAHRLAPPLSL